MMPAQGRPETPIPVLLLAFFPDEDRGGQVNLLRLIRGFDRNRFTPTVVVPSEGTLAAAARQAGAAVEVLTLLPFSVRRPWIWPAALRAALRLRQILKRSGARVVYVDGPFQVPVTRVAGVGYRVRVLWHAQTAFGCKYDRLNVHLADR